MRVGSILLLILTMIGCKREAPPATLPSTAPAEPATLPATLPVGPAIMFIDQHRYEFPIALVTIQQRDGQRRVDLMSDDPPEAALEGFDGNTFLLSMPIETLADGEVDENAAARPMQWQFHAPNTERAETVEGIMLNGGRLVLQPNEASATIITSVGVATVSLSGTFMMFEDAVPNSLGRKVAVMADLVARERSTTPTMTPATRPGPASR